MSVQVALRAFHLRAFCVLTTRLELRGSHLATGWTDTQHYAEGCYTFLEQDLIVAQCNYCMTVAFDWLANTVILSDSENE